MSPAQEHCRTRHLPNHKPCQIVCHRCMIFNRTDLNAITVSGNCCHSGLHLSRTTTFATVADVCSSHYYSCYITSHRLLHRPCRLGVETVANFQQPYLDLLTEATNGS